MNNPAKIKLLPPDLSNKIAAGEVVERPASVVKELVENAIDAGAREITVVLEKGGSNLIQVVDNGAGISREDMKLAFERHATSKISTFSDLEAIKSLGFRGEALASIASVSRVEIKSAQAGNAEGWRMRLEGGRVMDERPTGGGGGTNIAIKSLFYNTPARRKFLKADSTEYRHCMLAVNRFALCYPEIQFTLVHNGQAILEARKEPPRDRVVSVLGKRVQDLLIEVNDDAGAVKINGFAGTHDTIRRNSGEQYLFLNGRFITDRSLNHAVISGYGEILAHGGYPLYVLHLDVDPARVDVNVHPTKMQVKFADDRLMYSLLRGAVKSSLRSAQVIPEFDKPSGNVPDHPADQWTQRENFDKFSGKPLPGLTSLASSQISQKDFYQPPTDPGREAQLNFQLPAENKGGDDWLSQKPGDEAGEPAPSSQVSAVFTANTVWQLHKKYIISPISTGLLIVDQHAAHERIMYERALVAFKDAKPASQKLLFPVMAELSIDDFQTFLEMKDFLEKIGFMVKEFGKQTVVIEGVPTNIRIKKYDRLVQNMIDDYKRGKRNKLEIRDNIAKTFACHTAIRAGDSLNAAEIQALMDQLFAAETPYFCPHGRPVMSKISIEEMDKRFGRT